MNRKDSNILGTTEISYEIERMVDESFKFLFVVSPYLKLTDRVKGKLAECFARAENCFFVFRENELRREEQVWIESYGNVNLIPVKNLHAKIYLNENRCLITSMNLYEYSQINNHEIGVEIDCREDKKNYLQVLMEVVSITKTADVQGQIQKVLEPYLDFTAGSLFNKLRKISSSYRSYSSGDLYIKFSDDARKVVEIADSELYQDKSAILRGANLGKERYNVLLRELK